MKEVPNILLGLYRHYKGGIYDVLGVAMHTETHAPLVIYVSVDFGHLYARPFDIFKELVLVNGDYAPRFEKIKEDD